MSATPEPVIPRSAYITLAALFGLNLLNFTDRYILSFVLDSVQKPGPIGLGIGKAEAGLLGSMFLLTYALISPFVGWLGDRVTRKYLLAISVGIWSLATFGSGLAQTYQQMLITRAILAIGEATYTAVAPTLIADLFPPKKRGRVLTLFWLAVPLGAALGSLIAGLSEMFADWRMAFYVVGLPGLILAFATLALREPNRGEAERAEQGVTGAPQARASWRRYLALGRNRSFLFNAMAMAMYTFALGGLQHWTKDFFSGIDGLKESAALVLGPILCVSGIVGMSLGGWLADRLTRRWPGAYFLVSGVTVLASFPFFLGVLLIRGPWVWMVYPILLVALTLAVMNIGPSNTIIANVTAPEIRVGAVALNLFLTRFFGDIPSQYLMGVVGEATGDMFWGMALTLPALLAAGVFFCLGTPFLAKDQETVRRQVQSQGEAEGKV